MHTYHIVPPTDQWLAQSFTFTLQRGLQRGEKGHKGGRNERFRLGKKFDRKNFFTVLILKRWKILFGVDIFHPTRFYPGNTETRILNYKLEHFILKRWKMLGKIAVALALISFWEVFQFTSEKERLELASQKAEQKVLLLSPLQKLRIDTKYFRKLLSLGINSVQQFQENLDSVVLQKIFEYDDLLKLHDAALGKGD